MSEFMESASRPARVVVARERRDARKPLRRTPPWRLEALGRDKEEERSIQRMILFRRWQDHNRDPCEPYTAPSESEISPDLSGVRQVQVGIRLGTAGLPLAIRQVVGGLVRGLEFGVHYRKVSTTEYTPNQGHINPWINMLWPSVRRKGKVGQKVE